jgi:uncharacterized protein (TIGR03435 family)
MRIHRIAFGCATSLAVACSVAAYGQAADPETGPAFEVISIKPTTGNPVNSGFRRSTGGVLNATNVTVRFLIEWAYDVRDDQVSGGPAWLDSDRYEIVAKPAESESAGAQSNDPELRRRRTQRLLADRFHVVLHRGSKELPILILTLGKNGPKGLHDSTAARPDFFNNGHHFEGHKVSMALFAKGFLAPQTGRSVVDHTGVAGDFDFTLDWGPDDAPPTAATDATPAAVQFPPLLLAIQEQLGLKLEQSKGPVEVLVVDHAERPAEN